MRKKAELIIKVKLKDMYLSFLLLSIKNLKVKKSYIFIDLSIQFPNFRYFINIYNLSILYSYYYIYLFPSFEFSVLLFWCSWIVIFYVVAILLLSRTGWADRKIPKTEIFLGRYLYNGNYPSQYIATILQ